MTVRTLFATPFYEGKLKNAALVADLDVFEETHLSYPRLAGG